MKMSMKIFYHELRKALDFGDSEIIDNSDFPPCPKCTTGTMVYHGESYGMKDGDDYYQCPECGFKFLFDDIPYEED